MNRESLWHGRNRNADSSKSALQYAVRLREGAIPLRLARKSCLVCLAFSFAASQALAQGDFSLSAAPSRQTVWQAQSTSYLVTVTPSGGFSGTVGVPAAGLPTGATASFNSATVDEEAYSTGSVSGILSFRRRYFSTFGGQHAPR